MQETLNMLKITYTADRLIANIDTNMTRWQAVAASCALLFLMHGLVAIFIFFFAFPLSSLFWVAGSAYIHFMIYRYAKNSVAINIRVIEQIKEQHGKLNFIPPTPTYRKSRSNVAFH